MKITISPIQSRSSSFFSLLTLLLFFTSLKAQNYIDTKAWIKVTSSDYESSGSGEDFTNNESFNTFLESINVIKYQQALPFAKTPDLLKYYEVECNSCNLSDLEDYIENNSIAGITEFYKDEMMDTVIVHDVSDYMWWLQNNDPNYDHMWYLKRIEAERAWDITTGDTNVTIAILDTKVDITHPDLASEILLPYDPYTLAPHTCTTGTGTWNTHGTGVAGIASGETAAIGQLPAGQMPSIGYNTKMFFYHSLAGYLGFLQKCLHASNVMGVRVLVSSASSGIGCGVPGFNPQPIIKEILDNGTSIIVPAGNAYSGYNCGSDANPTPFYPLHPSYDDRLVMVTSTGKDDKHYQFANGAQRTHSRFSEIDVCAPGFDLMLSIPKQCNPSHPFPYYGYGAGTSFAAPLVAGIVSLMYSINPCLTTGDVQTILKTTTDPIVDAASYPGKVGTGRVNAFKAVQKAQAAGSTILDLYIKDKPEDIGISGGYDWQATRDNSPDIWVRRQNDGLTNQQHQDPEYYINNPNYIYVRVRNKSCDTSSSQETLRLYWSKASSWSSWSQNWDGSQPLIGNVIDSIIIPPLNPGKDTILEFTWNILNPYIHNNWSTCLLARIEDNPIDSITVYPGRIDDDVYFNNNIAMKNITIVDSVIGNVPPQINGALYPVGRFMFVGNVKEVSSTFDFKFSEFVDNGSVASITEEAELKLITDAAGWDLFFDKVNVTEGIEVYNEEEYSFIISNPELLLEDVLFPANTRVPIYVGFNFLIEEVSTEVFYTFELKQYESSTNKLLGGERFEVTRKIRNSFFADAGYDQSIRVGGSVILEAMELNEPAIYNWYDSEGELLHSGLSFNVTPEDYSTFTLEVISENDGYKDYDRVNVNVQYNWIESVSPNPANSQVLIDYSFEQGNSASIMLLNSSATFQQSYPITLGTNNTSLDVSAFTSGSYSVILLVDGVVVDNQILIIQ